MKLIFFIFLCISQTLFSRSKLESKQAEIMYQTAKSYYQNQYYKTAIETLTEYLFLYPNGRKENQVYELLEKSYEIQKKYENLEKLYLFQYTKSPFSDEGVLAYLKLGKLYVKIGEIEKGKRIFNELNQTQYSFLIKKKAEEELSKISGI